MSSYFFVTLQILLIEHSEKDNSHIKRVKFKYSIFSNINKIGIKIANILLIMPQAIDLNLKENLRRFLIYFKINLFSHLVKSNIIFLLFSIESNPQISCVTHILRTCTSFTLNRSAFHVSLICIVGRSRYAASKQLTLSN